MAVRHLPTFSTLLDKYPEEQRPCDQGWENQCAIRLSVALTDAGFKLTEYRDPLCKHHHARGAESLASYLRHQVGRPKIYTNAGDARAGIRDKTGIVFFKDITGFRGGRGDHIDLWDGRAAVTGEYFDACVQTWFWLVP